jgi:signal transduction histidine kinase
MRGFAYVLAFIIVADMLLWVGPELLGAPRILPQTMTGLTGIPFPIVVAGAILRHRAFDIDVVVRRSLVYGGLTVAVVVTYAVVAAGLGAVLGASSPFATSLLATGVAALLVLPLRDGLQRAVTRLLYGDRDEPVLAIRRLGERLDLSIDPGAMPRVVVDTVADALRLPYVGLELGAGPAARLAAEHGTRPAPGESIERPLTFQGRRTGRLIVGARGPTDPFSASDLALLGDLARQIGAAAHAADLTEDLRSSRERIVTAREEERRRLRRDLHDGLGPALAGIGMRADAIEVLLLTDPERAAGMLAELRGEVTAAVGDVRRVVDSLRPPAIDEVGLLGALRLAADRLDGPGTPEFRVTADGSLHALPAAVEVAAYRIASEAMLNVVRHAAASCCDVRLGAASELTVVVEDDGLGIARDRTDGVGLRSMHERAAELGGELRIETGAGGRGTRVVATLPLAGTIPSGGEP